MLLLFLSFSACFLFSFFAFLLLYLSASLLFCPLPLCIFLLLLPSFVGLFPFVVLPGQKRRRNQGQRQARKHKEAERSRKKPERKQKEASQPASQPGRKELRAKHHAIIKNEQERGRSSVVSMLCPNYVKALLSFCMFHRAGCNTQRRHNQYLYRFQSVGHERIPCQSFAEHPLGFPSKIPKESPYMEFPRSIQIREFGTHHTKEPQTNSGNSKSSSCFVPCTSEDFDHDHRHVIQHHSALRYLGSGCVQEQPRGIGGPRNKQVEEGQ